MARDEGTLHEGEESEDLLADPIETSLADDEDDEADPLIAGDEEIEDKDWM